MKVSFENPDKINGLLTITVEEEDYKDEVEKQLKDYRKRANIRGFRPGNAPMGLIRRQYGEGAKVDSINDVVGKALNKYIEDNKLNLLGHPMASEKQQQIDLDKPAPYVFMFDLAIAPEFDLDLTDKDQIDYYDITVDDALIDRQVVMFQRNAGHTDNTAKEYDATQNDLLKGDLREQKENGLVLSGVSLMPEYIKVDDQKKLFDGVKLGDIITFNPRKAYPDNDGEIKALLKLGADDKVEDHEGDFTFQVTEISRFVPAEVNQDLFDGVYGKDVVKSEQEFRDKIKEGLSNQLVNDSDYEFYYNVRKYSEAKVGELTFPDSLLKRQLIESNKDKKNVEEEVEKNYAGSIKALAWELMRDKLAVANNIQVQDADVKAEAAVATRAQFAQYGMTSVPDNLIEEYANKMLSNQESARRLASDAIDRKLVQALKAKVTLNHKSISLDDFNKMIEEQNKAE